MKVISKLDRLFPVKTKDIHIWAVAKKNCDVFAFVVADLRRGMNFIGAAANDLLVLFAGQAQRDGGGALRQDGAVQLRRTLCHQRQRDGVFAPFLGDTRQNIAHR